MEYIKAEETEYPICPFCEQQLREVKFKDLRGGFFYDKKNYFLLSPLS